MTYTSNMETLVQFYVDQLNANKNVLGIQGAFYGDQERIPFTPCVCVEGGEKDRQLNGAPRRTLTIVTIYFLVYHTQLKPAVQVRKDDDRVADTIEAFIHTNPQLRTNISDPETDQAVDSLVSRVESGYQQKSNSLFRASRLTLEVRVQEQLPSFN